MKICPGCGSSLTDSAARCPDCGYVWDDLALLNKGIVHEAKTVDGRPEEVLAQFYGVFADWFGGRGGWKPTNQSASSITYGSRSLKTWQIVCSILLFPIGLLSLLARWNEFSITATFMDAGEGRTTITMAGSVPPKMVDHVGNVLNTFTAADDADRNMTG
jgi:hypothetical protein